MKTLLKIFTSLAIIASVAQTSLAQDKKAEKIAATKQLIQSKNYIFKAEYMLPMAGSQQYLTSDYDVKITPDTLVSYLPYFGVVYFNAAYNSSADAGIQFTSTKFDYRVEDTKKGGYLVFIKPKDAKNTQQMIMDISSNGYAGLTIQSVNRQSIRFTGYIKEIPKPKI